ncbi:MAG: SPOR domain-containing protein [Candidatus Krumholzibacteriota bacterium]|nr:SPOR domain-containing protein [Candidatus Krumholzibacteriota bacterium]
MTKRALLILLALSLLVGCSPKEPVRNDPWLEPEAAVEAAPDTLSYDFLIEEAPPLADEAAAAETAPAEADLPVIEEEAEPAPATTTPAPVQTAPPAAEIDGPLYWVQIFAGSTRASAEETARAAAARLDERVRVEYVEPYYKVLVGGFVDREDAVDLRRDVVALGYEDAWIFEY